jgi:hypothetical protein
MEFMSVFWVMPERTFVQGSSERSQHDMAVLQADKVKENQKLVLHIENLEMLHHEL